MSRILIFLCFLTASACAYRFGLSDRGLPGGYTEVAIPVFKNQTGEVGIEMPFTNALVRRFSRSQVARVVDKETSPLILEGTISKIEFVPGPAVTSDQLKTLPQGAVLTTEYTIRVTAGLKLRRKSDDKNIWEGNFSNERIYRAPRIGEDVVNSANATYNYSVRMETIAQLAEEMMQEAHDRISENF